MRPILAFVLCAFWAFSIATVTQNTPPKKSGQTAAHSDYRKNQAANAPSPVQSEQRVKLHSPPSEEKDQRHSDSSAKPDWWARITNVFIALGTVALAIIGGIGACAAIRTLHALQRQTKALRDQSTTAVNSERAWVDGYLAECNQLSIRSYALKIRNHGKTAALISGYDVWYGCLKKGTPFNREKLRSSYTRNLQMLVGSGEWEDLERDIRMDVLFEPCDLQDGAYYVTIRYTDIVVGKEHETSFLYVQPPLSDTPNRISTENRYT